MPGFVALLRGINVGGNNKIDMKTLASVCEKIGWQQVKTYINSGNVIFESQETNTKLLAKVLQDDILVTFGFVVKVLVIKAGCIEVIAEQTPVNIQNNADMKTDVLFLWGEFDSEKSVDLIKHNIEVDALVYLPGAILWSVLRNDYAKSGMNTFIGSVVYKNMTARNINTVRKIAALLS